MRCLKAQVVIDRLIRKIEKWLTSQVDIERLILTMEKWLKAQALIDQIDPKDGKMCSCSGGWDIVDLISSLGLWKIRHMPPPFFPRVYPPPATLRGKNRLPTFQNKTDKHYFFPLKSPTIALPSNQGGGNRKPPFPEFTSHLLSLHPELSK